MRKIFALFASLLLALSVSAEKGSWNTSEYKLVVYYNQNTQPGDAIFVRLMLETANDTLIKTGFPCTGTAKLYSGSERAEKDLAHSDFYSISEESSDNLHKTVLLTGLPLSSYLKAGDYTVFVTFSPFGMPEAEFKLPVKISAKEFVKETIQLNAQNTAIKTNDSNERWQQIKKLNSILEAVNTGSIYCTSAFVPPTPATRRTSFFADRRVFAYSNGKSSTNLHYGIDYGIPTGSEVRACGQGKVVLAESRITTGWSVCIEHLPGLYSLYYHMSELKVGVGDMVKAGDLIGLSGATGLATGPHLHWEVRLNMEAVSPDFFVSDFTFEQAAQAR